MEVENSNMTPGTMEISLADLLKRLLLQWKAVLLVAVIMAVAVSGAMYAKAMKAYRVALTAAAEQQVMMPEDAEKKLEEVYSSLSGEDYDAVQRAVHLYDAVSKKQEYVTHSILQGLDPTHIRTMTFGYRIEGKDISDTQAVALYRGFTSSFDGEKPLNQLGKAIGAEYDSTYLHELIYIPVMDEAPLNKETASVLTIRIFIPDDSDEKTIKDAVEKIIQRRSKELKTTVTAHKIKRVYAETGTVYSREAMDTKTDNTSSLSYLASTQKTLVDGMSGAQKEAYSAIIQLKGYMQKDNDKETSEKESQPEVQKPGVDKKYVLVGVVFGAFCYACAYILLLILGKKGNSVAAVRGRAGMKVLGEYYYRRKAKGWKKLLSDSRLSKRLFGEKTERELQIRNVVATLAAMCKRKEIPTASLLVMTGDAEAKAFAEEIAKGLQTETCEAEVIACTDGNLTELLGDVAYAASIMSGDVRLNRIDELRRVSEDYQIESAGFVYVEGV